MGQLHGRQNVGEFTPCFKGQLAKEGQRRGLSPQDVLDGDAKRPLYLLQVSVRKFRSRLDEPMAQAHRLASALGVSIGRGYDDFISAVRVDAIGPPKEIAFNLFPFRPPLTHAGTGSRTVVFSVPRLGSVTHTSKPVGHLP